MNRIGKEHFHSHDFITHWKFNREWRPKGKGLYKQRNERLEIIIAPACLSDVRKRPTSFLRLWKNLQLCNSIHRAAAVNLFYSSRLFLHCCKIHLEDIFEPYFLKWDEIINRRPYIFPPNPAKCVICSAKKLCKQIVAQKILEREWRFNDSEKAASGLKDVGDDKVFDWCNANGPGTAKKQFLH